MSVTFGVTSALPYRDEFVFQVSQGHGQHIIARLGYDPNDTYGITVDPIDLHSRIKDILEDDKVDLDAATWRALTALGVLALEAYRAGEKIAFT